MYIIFNSTTGQLQCGFKSLNDVSVQHGIMTSEYYSEIFYYKNGNLIIVNNQYLITRNKKYLCKDYRINFKSEFIKKLVFNIFILIFKVRNKKNIIKKYLRGTILIIIGIKIFSMGYFVCPNPVQESHSLAWGYDAWRIYFKNSKIAHYIAQNKFETISLEIPDIKGISGFRVLPLNSSVGSIEKFKAKIALPYKTLISLKSDKSILLKNSKFNCENKKIYFFELDQNDDILVLSNTNFVGNNYNFTIFMDDSMTNNICNEELTAKHQIEE